MVTIIHGDDTAQSRNYYLSEREKHQEKIILEGANITLTDLIQATSGTGLFGDQQAIFIEELLSKRKASKELDEIIATLAKDQDTPLFLWESKELTVKQLSPFKSAIVKQFKIPQTVFAFLDSLLPRNGKKSIVFFHQLLQDEDVNFALFMLQRQIRILLAQNSVIPNSDMGSRGSNFSARSEMTHENDKVISEVKRMAPWQKGKLSKQANAFSQDTLLALHDNLYELELGQKTGTLTKPLDQEIDFLLSAI